ncbi:hypothetical protein TSUD_322090 [Trifolium subterraneum]|uniref:Reverse transcriptase zinc-binding domain-containing protein n=1 Tax=Trifolium subterraneum TaxID=3900 RepID=A0A2Z6N252_TRISU|nr:hypothetical protein TSUD_322090 [Trifolium subterraneum]
MLVGVNIPDSWLGEAASALRCKVGTIPFIYLGLSIGGDPRRLRFWEPLLARLKNRLSGWKSRFMSFSGRLVMLKSVLTSLPVYALSFFKAPSVVLEDVSRQGGLWFRVLAARYGLERGRLCAGGTSGSPWWREIERIRDGGGEIGEGGLGRISRSRWGMGLTLFYGLIPGWMRLLCVREGEVWVWRQPLRAWEEEMLGECQTLLLMDVAPLDVVAGLIWHSQVPLKVSILAWRLLQDRLPTNANLTTGGCLSSAVHHCVSGCGEVESAQHLFLSCSTFSSLWHLVSSWIGSSLVTARILPDHFVQFTYSAGGSRARRSFMQLICLACVWVVSTE